MSYFFLFFSAFLAGSLFPAQSEALLLALLAQKAYAVWGLLFAASVGNILGSCFNWFLGKQLERVYHKKWFPFSLRQLNKAQHFYQKYGYLSLLLSWLPVIGDPLTLIAGMLREAFWRFLLLVSVAKSARYIALYWLYSAF